MSIKLGWTTTLLMALVAAEPEATPPAEPTTAVLFDALPLLPKPQPQYSFTYPYRRYKMGRIPNWTYGGESTLSADYLMLTSATHDKVGWIWSDNEIRDFGDWATDLEFYMGGRDERQPGGGLALWYTTKQGRATGHLYGHDEQFIGMGIIVDSYVPAVGGPPKPFVTAIFNKEGGSRTVLGTCFVDCRNRDSTVRMRVTYGAEHLRVWIDNNAHSNSTTNLYQKCIDRSSVELPEAYHIGVTATTGSNAETHVVYSLKTSSVVDSVEPIEQIKREAAVSSIAIMGGEHHGYPLEVPLMSVSPIADNSANDPLTDMAEQVGRQASVPPEHKGGPSSPEEGSRSGRATSVDSDSARMGAGLNSAALKKLEASIRAVALECGSPKSGSDTPKHNDGLAAKVDELAKRLSPGRLEELAVASREASKMVHSLEASSPERTKQLTSMQAEVIELSRRIHGMETMLARVAERVDSFGERRAETGFTAAIAACALLFVLVVLTCCKFLSGGSKKERHYL